MSLRTPLPGAFVPVFQAETTRLEATQNNLIVPRAINSTLSTKIPPLRHDQRGNCHGDKNVSGRFPSLAGLTP